MLKLKKISAAVVCAALMFTHGAAVLAEESAPSASESAAASESTAAPAESAQAEEPAATGESTEPTPSSIDLSNLDFKTMYGSQIGGYLNHQYYFDGKKIPTYETNFYFLNSFIQLSTYASQGALPATNLGYADLSAKYNVNFDQGNYETIGDYFVHFAEDSVESTYVVLDRAAKEGVTLSDEKKKSIDDMIDNIKKNTADPAGVSVDEYLQLYYGPGCDETAFRDILSRYFLADQYTDTYCTNYKFTDEQKKVPNIRYALFSAPASTASEDDKKKAYQAATEMKNSCKSIDDITALAEQALKDGKVMDQGDITVKKGQTVSAFESWAYGEGRQAGQMDIIYAEEYGYFLVGYIGKADIDAASLKDVALAEFNQSVEKEIKDKVHEFKTDDKYEKAKPETQTNTPPVTNESDASANSSNEAGTKATDAPADDNSGPKPVEAKNTSKVLLIVFICIGGVAIVAIVVILIMSAAKKGGNDDSETSDKKPAKSTEKKPAEKKAEVTKKPAAEESDDTTDSSDEE